MTIGSLGCAYDFCKAPGRGQAIAPTMLRAGGHVVHSRGDGLSSPIGIKLRRSKKREWPSDRSRVGAGEELGGGGALVAARRWSALMSRPRATAGGPQGPPLHNPPPPPPHPRPPPPSPCALVGAPL